MSVGIFQISRLALTFTTSATTAASANLPTGGGSYQGWGQTFILELGTFASNSISGTLLIKNQYGIPVYTSPTQKPSTAVVYNVGVGASNLGVVPFIGNETIEVDLTAQPSGAQTAINVPCYATLYISPGT